MFNAHNEIATRFAGSIIAFIAGNPILNTDSYKASHYDMLPEGTTKLQSYIESRGGKWDQTVFFGLQAYLKEYLMRPITRQNIEDAAWFFEQHGEPFNREGWEYILEKYNGYLPLHVRAPKEGSVIPVKNCLVTVENTDDNCAWLTSYIEPAILRGVWYGTTVATMSWNIKQCFKRYMIETSDSLDGLLWKLHDFGARGCSSMETATLGGAAHLVNFRGSDTVTGAIGAMMYYGEPNTVASDSVPATEHSVMTIKLKAGEHGQILRALRKFGKKGKIFSVVSDSYNIDEAIDYIGSLKDEIEASGCRFVVRPDSGDPVAMALHVVRRLEKWFGTTMNSKHYKVLPWCVGVLYGDGINPVSINAILFQLQMAGYSVDNILCGMGGALLQNITRDDQRWAMKACAAEINGEWVDIFKDPITDSGKSSKAGRMSLFRNRLTGEFSTIRLDQPINEEFVDQLQTVYRNGQLFNEQTFSEVRARSCDPRNNRDELEFDFKKAA